MPYIFPEDTADLLALGLEFDNDPMELGYPAGGVENTDNDAPFAAMITAVNDLIQVLKQSVPTADIFNATDPIEKQSLSPQQAAWYSDMLNLGQINPSKHSATIAELERQFGEGTQSRAAFQTLLREKGSRLLQMFQQGTLSRFDSFTASTPGNIRAARAAQ